MTGRAARLVRGLVAGRAVTPGAVVLRAVVLLTGWLGLLVAVPSPILRYAPVGVVVVTAVLAAVAALVPRRHAVLILELAVVALWLLPGGHPLPDPVVGVVLGVVLYLHHATAALATATGWDVRVTGDLARAWSLRVVATVVAAAVLSTLLLALSGAVGWTLSDWALLAGLAAAVLAVAVSLVRVRRPASRDDDAAAGVSDRPGATLD
jgi:hypothetical protein